MKKLFLICALFYLMTTINCLEERHSRTSFKVSIIIPCYYKHFYLIKDLLDEYCSQTRLPDEIVISVSESNFIDAKLLNEINKIKWPFELNIILNENQLYAGGNRNCACENSNGDIIICQDADDIPHPQRIEIITLLFEKYLIDILLHSYITDLHFVSIQSDIINKCYQFKNFNHATNRVQVTNGQPAITREVFNTIKWPNTRSIGEDQVFNKNVYEKFKNNVVLDIPLIIYRNKLSAYRQIQKSEKLFGIFKKKPFEVLLQ